MSDDSHDGVHPTEAIPPDPDETDDDFAPADEDHGGEAEHETAYQDSSSFDALTDDDSLVGFGGGFELSDDGLDDGFDDGFDDEEADSDSSDDVGFDPRFGDSDDRDGFADVGVFHPDHLDVLAELVGHPLVSAADAIERLDLDADDLDARASIRVLDVLGVDARVEHGSVDALVEHLAEGGRIQLASDGGLFEVDGLDDRLDLLRMHSLSSGLQYELPLEEFEGSWAGAAFEMIVAGGAYGSDGSDPSVALLQLSGLSDHGPRTLSAGT